MPNSAVRTFADPYEYQMAVRASEVRMLVPQAGEYVSEHTCIDLHRLWMQRCAARLPFVSHAAVTKARSPIFFLAHAGQRPMHHTGMELTSGDIAFTSPGAEHYHRAWDTSCWAAMSLTPEDLAEAGRAVAGYDLIAPDVTRLLRPPAPLMMRLQRLHNAACHLAATTPDLVAHPEVARAMEQELVRVMVRCLTEGQGRPNRPAHQGAFVMRRFERVLKEHPSRPLYLTEICAAIGVAERTLRLRCMEHLGMSPHRYLLLRRMHLARRALALADPARATVTVIANDHGFGELGRFAVAYRQLFGEYPSATLRRSPDRPPIEGDRMT
jgi:AraC-like DNA-binding protein